MRRVEMPPPLSSLSAWGAKPSCCGAELSAACPAAVTSPPLAASGEGAGATSALIVLGAWLGAASGAIGPLPASPVVPDESALPAAEPAFDADGGTTTVPAPGATASA